VAKRVGLIVLLAVGAPLLIGLALLVEAHVELRGLERPLPSSEERAGLRSGPGGPVSVAWIESGLQRRSDGTYSTTGGFLLSWADGRTFLIDAGMTESGMREFGEALEFAMGADPAEVFGSVGAQLGPRASRLVGIGMTHLHHDHTEGAGELCAARDGAPLALVQLPDQADLGNYTTDRGREALMGAPCIESERLARPNEGAIHPVDGLPGLGAFAAGGHTPGSTVFVARLPDRLVWFAGDITNEHAALLENRGKSWIYSTLMVPENTGRLDELRRWLAARHAEPASFVVVSHDRRGMSEAGIEDFAR